MTKASRQIFLYLEIFDAFLISMSAVYDGSLYTRKWLPDNTTIIKDNSARMRSPQHNILPNLRKVFTFSHSIYPVAMNSIFVNSASKTQLGCWMIEATRFLTSKIHASCLLTQYAQKRPIVKLTVSQAACRSLDAVTY